MGRGRGVKGVKGFRVPGFTRTDRTAVKANSTSDGSL